MNSDTMQSVAIPMLGLVLATVFPAFLISVFAVGLVKRFAVTLGLLDEPNARKVHTVPIPLGGGLGIWLGVVGTFLLGTIVLYLLRTNEQLARELVPTRLQPHLPGLMSRAE